MRTRPEVDFSQSEHAVLESTGKNWFSEGSIFNAVVFGPEVSRLSVGPDSSRLCKLRREDVAPGSVPVTDPNNFSAEITKFTSQN